MWFTAWIVHSVLVLSGNGPQGTITIAGAPDTPFCHSFIHAQKPAGGCEFTKTPYRKKQRARLSESAIQGILASDFQLFGQPFNGRFYSVRCDQAARPGSKGRSPPRF